MQGYHHTIWSSNPTAGYIPRNKEKSESKRHTHAHHSSAVHNTHDPEATQVLTPRQAASGDVLRTHTADHSDAKKDGDTAMRSNVDEPREYHASWS